jgi:hypothetical protein
LGSLLVVSVPGVLSLDLSWGLSRVMAAWETLMTTQADVAVRYHCLDFEVAIERNHGEQRLARSNDPANVCTASCCTTPSTGAGNFDRCSALMTSCASPAAFWSALANSSNRVAIFSRGLRGFQSALRRCDKANVIWAESSSSLAWPWDGGSCWHRHELRQSHGSSEDGEVLAATRKAEAKRGWS